MGRTPNFKIDNDVYGKFGENVFEQWSNNKGFKTLNVTSDKEFQDQDIDFISIVNKEYDKERLLLEDKLSFYSEERAKNTAFTTEVKTDTRTFSTRNVVYELLSHDNPGCLARSKADFIFYVAVDEDATVTKEAWFINLSKWRKWLREHSRDVNHHDSPIKLNNYSTHGDGCMNFLCNIDQMVKDGIATKAEI